MRRLYRKTFLIALALCALTMAACSIKPTRILMPTSHGMTCAGNLCLDLDTPTHRAMAARLATAAHADLVTRIGPQPDLPRLLFCATSECFETFADPGPVALYFWGADTLLVSPEGWRPHILRHELIHHWQAKRFGPVRSAHALPDWYIEGMAYVLSDDPRPVIPNPKAQAQRARFIAWQAEGNDWRYPPCNAD